MANLGVNRSGEQRRCSVPAALRASAPVYAGRWGVVSGDDLFGEVVCFA
jgi:hypothetical protein